MSSDDEIYIVSPLSNENIDLNHDLIQAQFAQMRPITIAPTVAPRMPMYTPGGPGLGQQIFYGQAPPAMIPPQVIIVLFACYIVLLMFEMAFLQIVELLLF